VDALLNAGAKCNVAQSPAVPTPLHAAAAALAALAGNTLSEAGLAIVLAKLVAKHPLALALKDDKGRTPIDVAAIGLKKATAKGKRLVKRALRHRPSPLRVAFRAIMLLSVLFALALVFIPDP
jgi:hypothetical protein